MRTKASRKRELSIRHGSLPVIMITARTETSLEEKAMSNGATCFFASPLRPSTGELPRESLGASQLGPRAVQVRLISQPFVGVGPLRARPPWRDLAFRVTW